MNNPGQFIVRDVDADTASAVIELDGDLDYPIYTTFKKAITDLLAQGICNITYDLSKLTYIQSLGLGIIMWSYVELESRGGKITIAGANEKIKQVFVATQLDNLVNLQ